MDLDDLRLLVRVVRFLASSEIVLAQRRDREAASHLRIHHADSHGAVGPDCEGLVLGYEVEDWIVPAATTTSALREAGQSCASVRRHAVSTRAADRSHRAALVLVRVYGQRTTAVGGDEAGSRFRRTSVAADTLQFDHADTVQRGIGERTALLQHLAGEDDRR